jgi:hypothetical protein
MRRYVQWRSFVRFALCCVSPSCGERKLDAIHVGCSAWGFSLVYRGFLVMDDIKANGERKLTVHLENDRRSSELLSQAFASITEKAIVSPFPVLWNSESSVQNSLALQEN